MNAALPNSPLPNSFTPQSWIAAKIRVGVHVQLVARDDEVILGKIKALRYTVVEGEDSTITIMDVEAKVQWAAGGVSMWMDLSGLRRDLDTIPTFASTEEADAWMDADATARAAWVDRGLSELLGGPGPEPVACGDCGCSHCAPGRHDAKACLCMERNCPCLR